MSNPLDPAIDPDVSTPKPLLHLVRDIYSGNLDPITLTTEQRQAVVGHMTLEGYTITELAVILHCSERTVERDRRATREADSLEIDANLTRQIAGELMKQAQSTTARLRRVARDNNIPPNVRIMAEDRTFRILRDLLTTLVHVGLPAANTPESGFTTKLIELIRREIKTEPLEAAPAEDGLAK